MARPVPVISCLSSLGIHRFKKKNTVMPSKNSLPSVETGSQPARWPKVTTAAPGSPHYGNTTGGQGRQGAGRPRQSRATSAGRHSFRTLRLRPSLWLAHLSVQSPFSETLPSSRDTAVGEESACNAGDPGSIPRSGRSPGEGNGNPLQYSCLESPMDRGAWGFQSIGS